MITNSPNIFCQVLVLTLITQTLAGVLPNRLQPQRRHLSRRAIDEAVRNLESITGDHDIARVTVNDQSDQSANITTDHVVLISKLAEGESDNGNVSADAFETTVSESGNMQSVKSTKLLPALGNHDANTGEHKSGETMVLNRVESHESESTKEMMKENEMMVKEGTASSDVTNKPADTRKLSEEQAFNTTRVDRVFSHTDEWSGKSLPTMDIEKHINNGLDEMALRENDEKQINADSLDDTTEQQATTEEILKDLEDIAMKLNMPTTSRTHDVSSMLENKSERERISIGLEESMGRSMDAAHSSENKLEMTFGQKIRADKIPTTTNPMLEMKTNIEGRTMVSEESGTDFMHSHKPTTDAEIKEYPKEGNLNANESSEAETESLTKIITRQPAATNVEAQMNSNINNTSSVEKRAKFFNENSPSSQLKMNLPDGPEIWSLASMRTVPKTPSIDNKSAEFRWQASEILTTERTVNVSDYSEKNLLDWTKVMGMRSELESEGTVEKNLLTGNALEEDKIDSVKNSKTELPMQMTEKWETYGPTKINASVESNTTADHTTEGFAVLNAGHELSATQTMNEIDIAQTITKTTTMPTNTTNSPFTQTIQQLSSDSSLSVDNNDKSSDFTSAVVTTGTGEPLNGVSALQNETSTLRPNDEKAGVERNNSAEESSTQRQPSEDFNLIITSTTPLALLNVADDIATAMPILNETTPEPALSTTTTITALPVEQSTSTTTTTPPPSDVSEARTRWDNASALEAQPNTTEATRLTKVDAGSSSEKVDVSSDDGMHNATLEQPLKREPETVTETANANTTAEQATLLTVSEQPTSEANGPTSADERKSYVNANASAETGEGIATQNETPNVTTETTTESSHITETATINLINTTILSTHLIELNTTAKTSEVLAVTTEVSQIGSEVELEVRTDNTTDAAEGTINATAANTSNSDTGASPIEKLEETTTSFYEIDTTAKTVSPINELLEPVIKTTDITTTSPNTTTLPITTPPTQSAVEPVLYTATTLNSDENVNEVTTIIPLGITTVQANGSVLENTSTNNNTLTPVDFRNRTTVAVGTHDTESSIETNVIDQLDKTTVKISSTTTFVTTTTTDLGVAKVDGGEKSSTKASHTVSVFGVSNETTLPSVQEGETATDISKTTTTISTTMATIAPNTNGTSVPQIIEVNNTSSVTTTTEPPLINLLDESTTTPTTKDTSMFNQPSTATSKIAVNPQEVYTVLSTTEEYTSTSTAAIAPLMPIITTTSSASPPLDSSTYAFIPKVASTIATLTTTMLPPTLHAAIGGGSSAGNPSHMPGMINAGIRPNSSDTNETDVNVIIAITVSIIGVVALILLVAFLYLMRKRQKQMSYGQRCRPVSLDAYSLDNVSVLGSVRRKGALRASKRSYGNIAFDDPSLRHNGLSANELAKFVERRSSIFEEFRDVPQIIARADEVPAGCEDKNRYANVIPLPETRVVLQQLGDDDKTEYINANYVRGPKDSPNYYIATQAPLETTVVDFWRMIWEQQSRVIIQATDLYENGIEKCAEYLPPSVTLDNHTIYGDFQITLKHREVKDKYAISTLMLKNTAENMSRELTHYWYKWPEMGVPNEEAPIIAMLLEARSSLKGYVNESREKDSNATLKADVNDQDDVIHNGNGTTIITVDDYAANKMGTERVNGENAEINGNVSGVDKMKATMLKNQGPLTIHCSPGTGRTGTIIACDMAIRSLETPKRSVDIPQIVYYVRRGRASAVQTKEQYEFIYKVAHMYATKITNLSNDN